MANGLLTLKRPMLRTGFYKVFKLLPLGLKIRRKMHIDEPCTTGPVYDFVPLAMLLLTLQRNLIIDRLVESVYGANQQGD